MGVIRQQNFLGQGRIDVPHIRSIESAFAADIDVLAGLMLGEGLPLIIKGFDIIGSIGSVATALQINVAGASLIHYFATENGSIFAVPNDRLPETLTATNTKINGSFTPSSVNYVGIDLRRSVDNTTADLVQFLDADTLLEVPKIVPLARTLDYIISISTSDFSSTPTIAPIAKITTDAANNVLFIEDARQLFFRLGNGGSIPNRKYSYPWPQTKAENVVGNVFYGGDKSITGLKTSLNAIMTRSWELGGGEYWYSGTADRNVKMFRSGMVLPNGEYFYWDGTNLIWQGLTFIFPNSSGVYNDVKNQIVASPGLTDLAEGECIYVDLDYSQTRANPNGLQAVKAAIQLLGNPTIPGCRNIVAWRLNNVIFTRDSYFPVGGVSVQPATTISLGVVALSKAPTNPLFPIVLTNTEKNAALGVAALDASKNVIGAGLGRDALLGAGALRIGVSSLDKQVILNGDGSFNSTAVQVVDAVDSDVKGDYIQTWFSQLNQVSSLDNKGVFTTHKELVNNLTATEDPNLSVGVNGFSLVTHTGLGTGTIVPSGNCGTNNIYFILISTSGGLGVGQFRLSYDGGLTYSSPITIPGGGVYQDPNTFLTLTFAGLFVIQDVYWFKPLFSPLEVFNDNQLQAHSLTDHSGFPMGRRTEIREEWLDPAGFATSSSKWETSVTGVGFTAGILDAGSAGGTGQLYNFPTTTFKAESDTNLSSDKYFILTRSSILYPQALNVLDTTSINSAFVNSVVEFEALTDKTTANNSEYYIGWGDSLLSGAPNAAIYFRRKNQANWETVTRLGATENSVLTSFSPSSPINLPLRFRIETKNKFVSSLKRFVEDLPAPTLPSLSNFISMYSFPGGNNQWLATDNYETYYRTAPTNPWVNKSYSPSTIGNYINKFWASSDSLNATYAVTDLGYINKYDAGGAVWNNLRTPFALNFVVNFAWGLNQNDVWAVGEGGKTMHWDGDWTYVATPTVENLNGVYPFAPNDVWAVGNVGTILHWDGTIWSTVASPVVTDLSSVWGIAVNDVWAVATSGDIIHWDGVSWTSVMSPTTDPLYSVYGFASNDVWAVGGTGLLSGSVIIHWDGVSWTSVAHPSGTVFRSVWGINTNDVWVAGSGGAPNFGVVHWDGVSFSAIVGLGTGTKYRVFGFSSTDVYFLGGTGSLSTGSPFLTKWDGVSFSGGIDLPTGAGQGHYLGLWGSSPLSLWSFQFPNPYTISYGVPGQIHYESFSPNVHHYKYHSISGVWGSSSMNAWAVGNVGRVFFFNGTTWAQYPAFTDLHLYDIWGANANDIWAVGGSGIFGSGGSFFHWDGVSWTSVASPVAIEIYSIKGFDSNHIWAVGGSVDAVSGAFTTEIMFYNGVSWTSVASFLAPDNFFASQISVISNSEVYFNSGYVYQGATNDNLGLVQYNGLTYTKIDMPLYGGLPVKRAMASDDYNGTLYLAATDTVPAIEVPHIFKLVTGPAYVNTARFFINENLVSEMTSNVPGATPMKFQIGTRCGMANAKIRLQVSPLLIQIGRYTNTPLL